MGPEPREDLLSEAIGGAGEPPGLAMSSRLHSCAGTACRPLLFNSTADLVPSTAGRPLLFDSTAGPAKDELGTKHC